MGTACDMCRHACHLHIVDETKRRYRVARSRGYRLVRIDVVLEEWQYGIGQLDAFDADAFGHEMQRLLQRSRMHEARGALDVSLNRTVDGKRYWQVHAHLAGVLVPGDSLRALKKRLSRAVRSRDDAINVPIMVQKCDGTAYSLSYLEKERFTVKNTAHDGTIYKHAIRRGTDYSELMLFLAGLGLTGRQIRYRGGYLHFDDQVFDEKARLRREFEQELAVERPALFEPRPVTGPHRRSWR